jgi:hypothetical protein
LQKNGNRHIKSCLNRWKDDSGQPVIIKQNIIKKDFVFPSKKK